MFLRIFARHRPLDTLDDGRHRGPIVLELLRAIGQLDTGSAADVLVVRTLVRVLECGSAAEVWMKSLLARVLSSVSLQSGAATAHSFPDPVTQTDYSKTLAAAMRSKRSERRT